jgi:hypothetical protein
MLRRRGVLQRPETRDGANPDQPLMTDKDVPRFLEELTPKELMARLTAEGQRKMDAAFGRSPKNSD